MQQQRTGTRRIGTEELNRQQIAGEIEALKAQRSELESQMAQLLGRRNRLDEQRHVAPSGAARAQIESQIAEIDARSARLDMQITGLNDRISSAMGRLADMPSRADQVIRIPSITVPDFQFAPGRRGPDMRQIAGVMAAEAVALALIGFVFWRIGMKRMREQFERMFSAQTQQLSQLQQATDTIAIEVERISEAQRYVAKVLTEGSPTSMPAGKAGAQPVPVSRER